ncbi:MULTISPECIES: hypothetical protein [Psychrobacter]|jgi:hypothetical protein|uniref:Uncharacterized protein n=1 Tax=Psychrobacter glaciei TaxID=619771 RepID=A0ABQ3GUK7_9GAMM|nr:MULTISPECIES: hypothetical protein [Psychrobacter]MBP3947265.1 hypothetical protein [Psychrobacter sp. K31L]MCH1782676.1 hypothetical protein [Psychrobacter glaciei]GHD34344.1 hypothetical protein GCM10016272_19570 [Psychrobacter glaciei]
MKTYGSFKKAVLLSASVLIGITAANAHTTELSTSVINNCDAVTDFAKNLDHNDAQVSSTQMKRYNDARVACEIEHKDQHLQSEKYFVDKYGRDRDSNAASILNEYKQH